MTEKPKLLNYTRKHAWDVEFMPRPELFLPPFERAVSRVGYQTDLFHFVKAAESIEDLKQLPPSKMTWAECCIKRAEELLQLDKDRYYISYSGGIDSTAILVAILQAWPQDALKRVTVVLSHQSIEENPTFFDQHITKFHLRNYYLPLDEMLLKENAIFINGELGDQLFGSDMLMTGCKAFGDQVLKSDYKDAVPKILDRVLKRRLENGGNAIFEHFHPIVEECPFPIRTAHDFFWWFNFTQKWQHVKYRYLEMVTWNPKARYGEHVQTFYDSIDFQNWSLTNHDLKIRDTWESYKFVNKEFIYDYTKDEAQMKLVKVQSLVKTYFLTEKNIAVDSHFEPVKSLKDLQRYVRYDV